MKKYLGLAVVIGTVGMALACTATVNSTPASDAGETPDTGAVVDSGKKETSVVDSGPISCYAEDKAQLTIFNGDTKLKQGKCTPADITEFTDALLKTKSLDNWVTATSGDAGQAKKDCRLCIGLALKDDNIDQKTNTLAQPAVIFTDTTVVLNISACAAANFNKTGCNASTGKALTNFSECLYGACPGGADGCADKASTDACREEAAGKICKDAVGAASECLKSLDADTASEEACIGAGTTTFDDALPKILTAMCGGT